jgi:hypothetical protein
MKNEWWYEKGDNEKYEDSISDGIETVIIKCATQFGLD